MRKVAAFVLMVVWVLCLPVLGAGKAPALTFPALAMRTLPGHGFTQRAKLQNSREKAVLTYTSSNAGVATVTDKGEVTGVAPGEADITATAETNSGVYTASYRVTVGVPVLSIELGEEVSLAPGTRYQLQPVVQPSAGAMGALKFSSSNRGVASVSQEGMITARSRGTATITARAQDGSGVKATVKVVVKNYRIVIRSQQGAVIRYPVGRGAWEIAYETENQAVHPMGNDYHSIRVVPLKAGADKLTVSITYYGSQRTRDYTYSVFVAPDALLYTDDEAAKEARRATVNSEFGAARAAFQFAKSGD